MNASDPSSKHRAILTATIKWATIAALGVERFLLKPWTPDDLFHVLADGEARDEEKP